MLSYTKNKLFMEENYIILSVNEIILEEMLVKYLN